jgi:hypothetical protein
MALHILGSISRAIRQGQFLEIPSFLGTPLVWEQ